MSSIAGVVRLDGAPVSQNHLQAMLDSMAMRGPDGAGVQVSGSVGLGHGLLRTTPESDGEQQPVYDEESDCRLVADIRLDNREELIKTIETNGLPGRGTTDAELVLRGYRLWGDKVSEHLLGDFSFALWDGKRRRLLCVRDPVGVKPFYYYRDRNLFLFASELKPLFSYPGPTRRPNELMMGLFLADDFSDQEQTLYRNAFRLPAAHRMTLEGGRLRQARYWDVRMHEPIFYKKDEEYTEHFRELFTQAVSCRLRGNGPVAAFLSGGLDSGSIVSVAQDIYEKEGNSKSLETFSGYYEGIDCDEREYIQEITRRWPIRSRIFSLDHVGASTYAEEFAEQFEFIHDATLCFYRTMTEMVRKEGFRVILSGIGGDEYYSGSAYTFADQLREGRVLEVIRQINICARTHPHLSRRRLWTYYVLYPLLPGPLRNMVRSLYRSFKPPYPPWINPQFAQRIGLAEQLRKKPPPITGVEQARRFPYEILHGGYWSYVMEATNAVAASQSVELRYPYADARLVDFALRIPGEQVARDDLHKRLLRRAVKGLLPEAIRQRKDKTIFDQALERDFRERPMIRDLLGSLEIARDGYVNTQEVRKFFDQVCRGGSKAAIPLYSIFSVELWYRFFSR